MRARFVSCIAWFALLTTVLVLRGFAQGATYSVCASGCNATTISEALGLIYGQPGGGIVSIAPGTYDQEVACDIINNVTLLIPSAEVTVDYAGVWLTVKSGGDLTIQSDTQQLLVLQAASVVVENGSVLHQFSPLFFTNLAGSSAVSLSGVWDQRGLLVINQTSVTDALVDLSGGTWQQFGNASLALSHRVPAVRFGVGGQWFQRGVATITLSPSSYTSAVAAVDLSAGGLWLHMMDSMDEPHTDVTVAGTEVYGVHLGADSFWGQYGRLSVKASQAATGVVHNSTSVWTTIGRTAFSLVGSTGVRLMDSTSKWTQQGKVGINAGRQSTGIDFSSGGTWRQFSSTSLSTTDATATGVACGSSTGCCAQVSSPTLVKIISTSRTGRENDCAAAAVPTPLPSAVTLPITTAAFGNNASSVAISGDVSANQSVSLELSLSGLQLGFVDSDLQGLDVTRTEANTTEGSMTSYSSQIDVVTTLVQTYTFYREARPASFAGVNFTVAAGTMKWSFNLSITNDSVNKPSSAVIDAQENGFTLRYRLSGLSTETGSANASTQLSAGGKIARKRNTPQQGMTTFAVTLSGDVVAQVEVLNAALIDDKVTTLGRIDLVWVNESSTDGGPGYALELVFPPFSRSVQYDPSLGFGVLLGRDGSSGGGSSTDVGLIVGVSVAIPLAVAFVLVVIVVGLVLAWRRRKQWAASASVSVDVESDQEDQL